MNDQLKETLAQTAEIFESEELEKMVKSVAKLSFTFFQELCELGMSPDYAAMIAASYSGNIGKNNS